MAAPIKCIAKGAPCPGGEKRPGSMPSFRLHENVNLSSVKTTSEVHCINGMYSMLRVAKQCLINGKIILPVFDYTTWKSGSVEKNQRKKSESGFAERLTAEQPAPAAVQSAGTMNIWHHPLIGPPFQWKGAGLVKQPHIRKRGSKFPPEVGRWVFCNRTLIKL